MASKELTHLRALAFRPNATMSGGKKGAVQSSYLCLHVFALHDRRALKSVTCGRCRRNIGCVSWSARFRSAATPRMLRSCCLSLGVSLSIFLVFRFYRQGVCCERHEVHQVPSEDPPTMPPPKGPRAAEGWATGAIWEFDWRGHTRRPTKSSHSYVWGHVG